MTILLYDYYELEERASRHLRVWKAWHTILFIFAAVFGILNYIFLQKTMQLVGNHCVLYPRTLEFREVELQVGHNSLNIIKNDTEEFENTNAQENTTVPYAQVDKVKREVADNNNSVEAGVVGDNVIDNTTYRTMLDTSRSIFGESNTCDFAEFMPIMSTIFAIMWITFFTMCPGGGHSRSGLQQPWRILAPALIFSIIMVGLTGHSFTTTNGGLQSFCAAFYNITNATTCSSVNPHLELGWNATWQFYGRTSATRAASAAVWASWACAAALLMARCLAAPDFELKQTGVFLTKDPKQKITPYLNRSPRRPQRSPPPNFTIYDSISVKSEPTVTTELVTASVEHQESAPTSLMTTPRHDQRRDLVEMTHSPQEFYGNR